MQRLVARRGFGFVLGTVVLAACTGTATAPPTQAPTAAPTAAATAAPTELPGTKSFAYVNTAAPGLSSAPLLAAMDTMRSQGYKIDQTIIEQTELVTQGVATGQFPVATGSTNSVLAAVEKGAKINGVIARVANEWTLYARKSTIKTCADLAGKKLAIHSEGGVSTAMVRNYINTICPGTTPNYVVIAGSPNRVAALIADQIDASPLELGDALAIEAQAGDRFGQLSSFASDLPNLQVFVIIVNSDWAKANPGTVVALVKAILTEYRRISGNAAALQADAEKYTKDTIDPKTIAVATKKYTDLKMFDVNGGLTKANLEYSADFFKTAGVFKADIPISAWSDLTYLDIALKDLGRK